MPKNFDRNVFESHMFHITVTGYAYQAGAPIDLVFVGYSYKNADGSAPELLRNSVVDRAGGVSCTSNSTSYWGSDNNLYLRFHLLGAASTYFSSFRIESMNVGNGIIMKQGDIGVIMSNQPEL